mgnify:CR=1 FL=1
MKESKSATKDPICGMTVDEATAVHTERDGETFYFCSDHCRQKFLRLLLVTSVGTRTATVTRNEFANATFATTTNKNSTNRKTKL